MSDPINSPEHYTFGKYEVIDVLMDWFRSSPLRWQVGKYLARAGRKGDAATELEDLKKAEFYLKREIAEVQKALAMKQRAA